MNIGEDGLDRMVRNEQRLGRVPPRDEQIRRAAAPMREAADAHSIAQLGDYELWITIGMIRGALAITKGIRKESSTMLWESL